MHHAVRGEAGDAQNRLKANGANINARNKKNQTPMNLAQKMGKLHIDDEPQCRPEHMMFR